ncbi:MAG TPA: hypothetical protein VGQ53_20905, partial [Chitinophagaceae bacterium]|nr:hypothetical protein [Chitinophagaceae bacterium]
FTDRGPGYWLVLSETRSDQIAKDVKAYRIHATGNRSVKGKLLCMCQNIVHGPYSYKNPARKKREDTKV